MSRRSPFVIDLADEDRQRLEAMVRRGKTELRMAIRAWIVLYEDSVLPTGSFTGTPNKPSIAPAASSLNVATAWIDAHDESNPDSRKNF